MNPLYKISALLLLALCVSCASDKPSKDLVSARQNFEQKDYSLAYDGLYKLAKRGNAEAQYAIGYMTYYGMGTSKDEALARLWIHRSAKNGYPDAITAQKMITNDSVDKQQPELIGNNDHYPQFPNQQG